MSTTETATEAIDAKKPKGESAPRSSHCSSSRWRAAVLMVDGSREVFDVPRLVTHDENDNPLECYVALGIENIAAVAVFSWLDHNFEPYEKVRHGGRYFWFPHGADEEVHRLASERAGLLSCGSVWWDSSTPATRETPSLHGVIASNNASDPIRVAGLYF